VIPGPRDELAPGPGLEERGVESRALTQRDHSAVSTERMAPS
jgi:hypothetical protein